MKNFYFFQVNYAYGKSAHLPYTAAFLSAYALADERLRQNYELKDIFFLRDKPEVFLDKLENPGFIGFSSYIWNFEFNKVMAKAIKDKYPDCVIVFGGHHVAPGGNLLEEAPYIDYLIHGEGEDAFRRLMLACEELDNPQDIPGVSFRDGGKVVTNPAVIVNDEYIERPSPYLEGYFDKILAEYPDTEFMTIIETTRGCPNSCTYCDWSNMKSRIRKFPMQHVLDEIRWISEHHIVGLGSADSNFGIFERDEEITDYIIEMHEKNRFPIAYQASYAKNSNERIFRIGKKLEEHGLSKGITLSFQSMSDTVLENIGRKNMSVDHYSELMDMYNRAGIATYTELILGMPGETYESFADGIDTLLNLGQHNSIYVHNCEHLPCAVMANDDYVEKFGIKSSRILLNQPHIEPKDGTVDDIEEYSAIVVETSSMTREDWVEMNLFSFVVQCFHHMGILQLFALYLHNEYAVPYRVFYERLKNWIVNESVSIRDDIRTVISRLKQVAYEQARASLVVCDSRFGNVHWPPEEFLFIACVDKLDELFEEIRSFLLSFNYADGVFDELLAFQKTMIKRPFFAGGKIRCGFNFCEYFRALLSGECCELKKGEYSVEINAKYYDDKKLFAKEVAWFGRRDKKNIYINDSTEFSAE